MDPRDGKPFFMGVDDLGKDLIERQRGGVHDARPVRRRLDDLSRHQRAGIKADGTGFDQSQATHRNEIRRAGTGSDEVDRHSVSNAFVSLVSPAPMPVPDFRA